MIVQSRISEDESILFGSDDSRRFRMSTKSKTTSMEMPFQIDVAFGIFEPSLGLLIWFVNQTGNIAPAEDKTKLLITTIKSPAPLFARG